MSLGYKHVLAWSILFCTFFFFTAQADTPPESALQMQFNGVSFKLNEVLQQSISTPDYVTSADIPLGHLNHLVEYSYGEIQHILQTEGYFHAKVIRSFVEKKSAKKWLAIYDIFLGPRTLIRDVDIQILGPGKNEVDFLDLIHHQPLQKKMPFTQAQYNGLKSDLLTIANNLGYFEAAFSETKIEMNLHRNEARIILKLSTGERYRLGKISFIQDKPIIRNDLLFRFLSVQEEHYYDIDDIQKSYNDLMKSNYFETAHVDPQPDAATKTVNMVITLTAKKPQQYTIGLGYGTDTGPRALLGFQQRYLNQSGQYFTGQAQISSNYTRFSAYYVIPGKDPRTDSHRIGGSRTYSDVTSYLAHETAAGYQFIQHSDEWEIDIELNQYFVIYTENWYTRGHSKYLIPRLALSYFILTPNRHWDEGFNLAIDMTGTIKNNVTSDTTFIRNTTDVKYAYSLNDNNRVFFNGTFGALGVAHILELAPTMRFYAGGVNSVRGYSYKSLGPSANSLLVGGKYLLTASVNYERYLLDHLSGLLFYDIGNAYNELSEFRPYHGAGFGISWHSPVGPLKFYLSRALSLPGDHWRFDLSIGAVL
jgi:translocation and assembly module TamA